MTFRDRDAQIAQYIKKHLGLLEGNSAAFLERVYAAGVEPYARRLAQYGLVGLDHILDAGCGFGQWTLALAGLDRRVTAIDVASDRLMFLDRLLSILSVDNAEVRYGSLEAIPAEARSFDGVFCYGALFLSPWKEALDEFARVLRPGGLLYVNANGAGWYRNLWENEPNKIGSYDPRRLVGKALSNTWAYQSGLPTEPGVDVLIEPRDLEDALLERGFADVRRAGEGELTVEGFDGPRAAPFFPADYAGEVAVYEVLATRGAA